MLVRLKVVELGQLATFLAVVRTGTVNGAAVDRGLAPSSVSAQVRALEQALGVAVFERTARGMRLTEAGERLRPWAQRLLQQAERARQEVTAGRPKVRLGALETLAAVHVPAILARFATRRPDLDVDVRTLADRMRLLRAVRDGEVDAALVFDTGSTLGDLGFTPSSELEFVDLDPVALAVVAGTDHPLVGRTSLTVAEVGRHPLLVSPPACSFGMLAGRLFGTAGPRTELASITVVRAWATRGLGAALLPEFVIHTELAAGTLHRLDLVEPVPELYLRLVWRRDREAGSDLREMLYAASA